MYEGEGWGTRFYQPKTRRSAVFSGVKAVAACAVCGGGLYCAGRALKPISGGRARDIGPRYGENRGALLTSLAHPVCTAIIVLSELRR
jgi:hypothetical protein